LALIGILMMLRQDGSDGLVDGIEASLSQGGFGR
jgi:hypothetical protein